MQYIIRPYNHLTRHLDSSRHSALSPSHGSQPPQQTPAAQLSDTNPDRARTPSPRCRPRLLVGFAGDFGASASLEKVEVGAFGGLHNVVDIEFLVATGHGGFRRFPGLSAFF